MALDGEPGITFPGLGPRQWLTALGGATAVAAFATLFTLLANVLILRLLPVDQAGQYALLTALVPVLALIGGLGQPGLLMRRYSLRPPGHFDWVADTLRALAFSLPGLGLCVAAAAMLYPLSLGSIAFLGAAAPLLVLAQSAASLLNAHRFYVGSTLLVRLPNSLMILPALLALLAPRLAQLGILLGAHLVAIGLTLAAGVALLARHVPRGKATIAGRDRWEGLSLGVLAGTHLLLDEGLLAIAGSVVSPNSVAAFAAIEAFVRPLYLLQNVTLRVLTVEVVRDLRLRPRRIALALWGGGALLAAGLILLLPFVIPWVYSGRFDEFIGLGAPLALMGGLLLTETLPRSTLVGRGSSKDLRRFATAQTLIALAGVALILVLARSQGILGAAWAGAVVAGLRTVAAYGFYLSGRWRPAIRS